MSTFRSLRSLRIWTRRAVEFVGVALLTTMFAAFVLQIVSRYVFDNPIGWTLEACLLAWLWVVFWGAAFMLRDGDHVRFDILYIALPRGPRRVAAALSALAIVAAFAWSLPPTWSFVSFMAIEQTSLLKIRFDYVFSSYMIFAVAVIVRYAARGALAALGRDIDDLPPVEAEGR